MDFTFRTKTIQFWRTKCTTTASVPKSVGSTKSIERKTKSVNENFVLYAIHVLDVEYSAMNYINVMLRLIQFTCLA